MALRRQRGLKGIDNVIRNVNRQMERIKNRSMKGMIRAAAVIREDMDKTPPLIPVDTGNLRGSWFTTTGRVLGNPYVVMGFSAIYAVKVHEEMKKGRRPGSGGKFFESSIKRNTPLILKIIADEAMIR